MTTTPGWVRRFHPAADGAEPTVIVFPHAGGGASAYRLLSAALTERGANVMTIQYPGRQDRAAQPHPGSLSGLAQGAVAEIVPELSDAPVTLFGHSMGAVVAFEAARALEARGVRVEHLVPSASVPPSRVAEVPPHPTTDEELLAHTAMLEGTDPAVLAESAIARMALPAMRADFAAFDAYSCEADVAVAARITALGGLDDGAVPPALLHGWSAHTTAGAQVRLLSGGHFFVGDHLATIADLLSTSAARA